ncbi:hypothetical protein AUTU_09700 [Aureibacter tunicatorum]|nr:hypothetical protein AUTU_09700 [Aureibacter tunicatorum]
MKQFLGAFGIALFTAFANALFAFGQKKANTHENPFLFAFYTLLTCCMIFFVLLQFFPKTDVVNYAKINYKWILASAIGYCATFSGFLFLYKSYGTSYYTLYAVLSILTTSILLGIIYFKEEFNIYYLLSSICAIGSIFLFFMAKK